LKASFTQTRRINREGERKGAHCCYAVLMFTVMCY